MKTHTIAAIMRYFAGILFILSTFFVVGFEFYLTLAYWKVFVVLLAFFGLAVALYFWSFSFEETTEN